MASTRRPTRRRAPPNGAAGKSFRRGEGRDLGGPRFDGDRFHIVDSVWTRVFGYFDVIDPLVEFVPARPSYLGAVFRSHPREMAKHLRRMTKATSKEWGRYKVCVNCVAFGFIDTRLTKPFDDPASKITTEGQEIQAGVPAAALSALAIMAPLGRAGTPEEAAGSVYLMCIPESDYVSGQVLLVGGGISN